MSKAAVRKIRANIRAYGRHTALAVAKRGRPLAIAGAIATDLRVLSSLDLGHIKMK